MMLFIHKTQSALIPCNSFPIIFGGLGGNTNLEHMDAYDDYLAISGLIYGNSLITSTSTLPYIAVASVSVSYKYYWAIAFQSSAHFHGL